jgi:hypothetical protein
MGLQSFVVSKDQETLRQLRIVLNDLGVGIEVISDSEQALERLTRRKFELVVLDSEICPPGLLAHLRKSQSNHSTVVCGLGVPAAHESAYNVILPRPFTLEDAWRKLREVRTLMEEEQQRYHREQVQVPVIAKWHSGGCAEAQGCNISVSGMAIGAKLPARTCVTISFALGNEIFEVGGEVAWTTADQSGIHFINLSDEAKLKLESWIAERRRVREFSFVRPFPHEKDKEVGPRMGA